MSGDLRLVRQYLAGRDGAFDQLLDRHNPSLYTFCYYLSRDADDAEDLCQTAWVEAIRSLPTYRAKGSFRAWLHAIARNLHRSALRRAQLDTVALDPDYISAHPDDDPSHILEREEEAAGVRAAIHRLDPEHREPLILHELQGFKYREIAQILGCPIGTVKSRLHRAVAVLRAELSRTRTLEEVQP